MSFNFVSHAAFFRPQAISFNKNFVRVFEETLGAGRSVFHGSENSITPGRVGCMHSNPDFNTTHPEMRYANQAATGLL